MEPGRPHPLLRPGLRVRRADREVVVIDAAAAVVHRCTGAAAEVIRRIVLGGEPLEVVEGQHRAVVVGLREAGVLRGSVDRRAVVGGATAASMLGIVTLALPAAARAASPGGSGGGSAYDASTTGSLTLPDGFSAAAGYTYRTFTSDGSFVVGGTGTLRVDVLMIGGGGGGGDYVGAGGAGGAVSLYLAQDLAVGASAITVGEGASGGTYGGSSDGDPSSFAGVGTAAGGGGGGGYGYTGPPYASGGSVVAGAPVGVGSAAAAGGSGALYGSGGGAGAGGDGAGGIGYYGGNGGSAFDVAGVFDGTVSVAGGGGGAGASGAGTAGTGGSAGVTTGSASNASGFGGGAGGGSDSYKTGGNGGGGLVVVRYATP
jgi:hypothetical protein